MLHMCILWLANSEKALSRRKFTIRLSEVLLVQLMEKPLNVAILPRSTKNIICELLKLEQNNGPTETLKAKEKGKCVLFAHVSGVKGHKFCLSCCRKSC
ncbi:hypothetical protein TNCT_465931 [Trichonephila clavata]|uniref:Uncharacterized protein n=1 Tax=Trichonephila clavata TaxID=2740835 RepID=A0A8X6F1F2_TRICU|nr:hypothetical protein TNCT_465931 [Trichonephila clavata]